jgi:hypothetical protein
VNYFTVKSNNSIRRLKSLHVDGLLPGTNLGPSNCETRVITTIANRSVANLVKYVADIIRLT